MSKFDGRVFVVASLISICACAHFDAAKVSLATQALHELGTFYGQLVQLKAVPDYTREATLALAVADSAAETLKRLIALGDTSDEELNVAVGKAVAARRMYECLAKDSMQASGH